MKNLTQTACGFPARYEATNYEAICVALMVLTTILVLSRMWFKWLKTTSGICIDDLYIFATWLAFVAGTVYNHVLIMGNGLGRDIWVVGVDHAASFLKGFYLLELCYFAEMSLTKLSLIAFYMRVFPNKSVQLILTGSAVFVAVWGIAFFLTAVFQCTPVNFFWDQVRGEGGSCVSSNALALSHAVVNLVLDFWLLAIPLSQLYRLQMKAWRKVGVTTMFIIGSL